MLRMKSNLGKFQELLMIIMEWNLTILNVSQKRKFRSKKSKFWKTILKIKKRKLNNKLTIKKKIVRIWGLIFKETVLGQLSSGTTPCCKMKINLYRKKGSNTRSRLAFIKRGRLFLTGSRNRSMLLWKTPRATKLRISRFLKLSSLILGAQLLAPKLISTK
mgnify:CR=1 FL=1